VAPELFSTGKIDHRVDIYALGLVASEIFCGLMPHSSPSPSRLVTVHASHLPPTITEVIERCLAVSPLDRFSTVESIINLLQNDPQFATTVDVSDAISAPNPEPVPTAR
jgi:serine/threonine-protein kinase